MDVPELLERASLLVPEAVADAGDVTVSDVWEYLVQDEWEVALSLLEELSGVQALPPALWEALADAAEELRLGRSAAWCRWRWCEARSGVIRADLALRPAAEARRKTPVPGAGVLRPLWDIGARSPSGGPAVGVAALWVENLPSLAPGGRAAVRLLPLTPAHWRHVTVGQRIALHEDRTVAGTTTVLEVRPPVVPG
ncbi:hypothetical protein [Streptomyces sp. G45]|uniref:hypothetical protein n=1 Tax=Streptomyces sp. G45 TaxID=3406627 RepID=UPI003C294219